MNYQFMRRSHVLCPTMPSGTTRNHRRAATATEARNSNPSGVRETNRISTWLLRVSAILTLILSGGMTVQAAGLVYSGSTPENNSTIKSLEDITLHFDFNPIIEEFGEAEWGVCCMAYYSKRKPAQAQCATLYKGAVEENDVIERLTTSIYTTSDDFKIGSDFILSFPDIPVEPNQVYTLVLTYDMYAGRKDVDDPWLVDTQLALLDNPIVLTFIGDTDAVKVLNMTASDVDATKEYESIPEINIDFSYPIIIGDNAHVELQEDGTLIASTDNLTVDPNNGNTLHVVFPDTEIYLGHTYQIVVPQNTLTIDGEPEAGNREVTIPIKGASYRYFGTGRIAPTNGSTSVLDEIIVIFNFPEVPDKNYGFINVDNGKKKWYCHIYEGADTEGEEVMALAGVVGDDMKSLIFRPNYGFEPETEYTLVINEGEVLAYEIGGIGEKYLRDYLSERVELHYTTPAVESLPEWNPAPVNVQDNDEVEYLDYFIIDSPEYRYGRNTYTIKPSETLVSNNCTLYRVTENGDEVVKTFRVRSMTLNNESKIGNGEYIGTYLVGEVNEPLFAGNEYKLVLPERTFIINSGFIGRYIGNPEIAVTLKGAARTSFDVTCSYGEAFSIANVINRGEGTTIRFTPSEEWAVDTVTVNGEEAELTDGVLILSDVTEDMNISVSYKFTGGISFNYSTGVDGVEDDCPYFVALGESYVALSGLEIGSTVEVYNTVGMLLGTSVATDSKVKIDTVPGLAVVVIRKTDAAPVAITVRIP